MTIDEVFQHFNSMDPQKEVSRNTEDSTIMTTTFSTFKTICGLSDVKMAEFKRKVFSLLGKASEVVGNKNIVIRLGKKPTYFEVFDLMFVHLDEAKLQELDALYNPLEVEGYNLLAVDFQMPEEDEAEEDAPRKSMLTMMIKFVPPNEDPKEFFGYIV